MIVLEHKSFNLKKTFVLYEILDFLNSLMEKINTILQVHISLPKKKGTFVPKTIIIVLYWNRVLMTILLFKGFWKYQFTPVFYHFILKQVDAFEYRFGNPPEIIYGYYIE